MMRNINFTSGQKDSQTALAATRSFAYFSFNEKVTSKMLLYKKRGRIPLVLTYAIR